LPAWPAKSGAWKIDGLLIGTFCETPRQVSHGQSHTAEPQRFDVSGAEREYRT
jgi:hypothetical protein